MAQSTQACGSLVSAGETTYAITAATSCNINVVQAMRNYTKKGTGKKPPKQPRSRGTASNKRREHKTSLVGMHTSWVASGTGKEMLARYGTSSAGVELRLRTPATHSGHDGMVAFLD